MGRKENKQRKKLKKITQKLDKNERRHLLEFGESHPVNDNTNDNDTQFNINTRVDGNKHRNNDKDNDTTHGRKRIKLINTHEEKFSEPLDEDNDDDAYSQLLKSFKCSRDQLTDDHESLSESEDDNDNDCVTEDNKEAFQLPNIEANDQLSDDSDSEDDCDDITKQLTSDKTIDPFDEHLNVELNDSEIKQLNEQINKKEYEFYTNEIGKLIYVKRDSHFYSKISLKINENDNYYLKSVFRQNISKTIISYDKNRTNPDVNSFQRELMNIVCHYKDILFTERTHKNGEDIRFVYCLHSLNHILKTRSRILNHNSRLRSNDSKDVEYRDHGLTRPKILILVPFRESAMRIVKLFILLLFGDGKDDEKKINIMNMNRFKKEFEPQEPEPKVHKKPEDYEETFVGNTDDSFRVAIAITKKSLKLYAEFYSSDIIIASPLGLRTIIGADGEKDRDFDFLSSIEVLILDQTDVFLMQNWDHILHIFSHLHIQPSDSHGVDFSRVRMWSLEGLNKYFCQTLVFSSVCVPPIIALYNKFASNYEGQTIVRNPIPLEKASVQHVYVQCPQHFHRFKTASHITAPDDRFNYFINTILPRFKDPLMSHTLIYIPSYFDFVRLRNYFRKEELNFTQICEYTNEGKVAKGRSMFFHNGRHFMLFTERFHYYHRYRIKGIRHIIFYELPSYPHFYSEMCNLMHPQMQGKKFVGDDSSMSSTSIYSKYDAHQLTAIVGNEKTNLMLQSSNDIQMFVTESKF